MHNIKNIIITGATSSIGIPLINLCLKDDLNVFAVVRSRSHKKSRIPEYGNIKFIECDLQQLHKLPALISQKCDVLIHLGWETIGSEKNKGYDHENQYNNINYTIQAIHAANQLGCSKFIGAGSQAEYGLQKYPIDTSTAANPVTDYGKAKLKAFEQSLALCKQFNIIHIWARIFSAYGPYDDKNTLVNYVIKSILNKQSLLLTKCEQIWNYIYTEDVAKALYLMYKKSNNNKIYCIGNDVSKPLYEYVNIIKNIIDPKFKIEFGALKYQKKQVMNLQVEISDLIKDLDFKITKSFEDGIRETITHYKLYIKI